MGKPSLARKGYVMREDILVSAADLAELLGVSSETVYRMARDGEIISEKMPGERGKKFVLTDAVKAYASKLAANDDELRRAKLETERLKQRKLLVEVELAEGRAYPEEAVAAVMNDIIMSSRARLRSIPLDVAPKLGHTREQTQILADEIDAVLLLLSDYRKEDFVARNPQYATEMSEGE